MTAGLETAFAAHDVRVAYLFGSRATGRARPDSDVDIAVLWGDDVPAAEFGRRQAALGVALVQLLWTDAVDVVVLNEATPLLAMEVLRDGRILYNTDDALRLDFQVRALRKYRDTEPLRRLLRQALEERLREGTFGRPVPFVPLVEEARQC